ncbi:nuclear transport factor 2 family protein [Nocardia sp. AB354]|uniref:nuclear transport factor 2 family protein n=1 Tax=Nocardia sp. AB354 TaxID=3413283 RepID=UPI003C27DD09
MTNESTTAATQFEAKFQRALDRRCLKKPAPQFVQGNRSHAQRALGEDELNRLTRRWFVELEEQTTFYSEQLGQDVTWLNAWFKKYWMAWDQGVDEKALPELLAPDVEYKDPVSFGRPMIGIQSFIDYNQAFFDAIPDWRYDLLPGQFFINVTREGEVRLMGRYIGTGFWEKPLRMYPFDKSAPAMPATGAFMQAPAVDRYHFNADRQLYRGETMWDAFEAMQMSNLLPSDSSPVFRALIGAGSVGAVAQRLIRRR